MVRLFCNQKCTTLEICNTGTVPCVLEISFKKLVVPLLLIFFIVCYLRVEFGKLNAQYKTVNVGQVRTKMYIPIHIMQTFF